MSKLDLEAILEPLNHSREGASEMATAVYPGSFNPPTVAHLAISKAALHQREIDTVVWSVSRVALGKEKVSTPTFEHRIAVLEEVADQHTWLQIQVTNAQLLADIAVGYDLLIMGADKWHQIQDPIFYNGDPGSRDLALAELPELAIVPREPFEAPSAQELKLPENMDSISSSKAREGSTSLMLPPAQNFDQRTGAWTNVEKYELWLTQKTD
ncbi:MAG TPA: hypothetical protein DCL16_08560 [Acidimicrobiaceae bacterium]|nr:hypothetical protein [Acidimicrobiaceae bacterium]|tara:strand:+ start:1229 stop:1864 length:636 start_codon:yes stop_codon:yes gene_type:complete